MKPITLFLMTRKGYSVLNDSLEGFGHLFEEVVVARDINVANDYYDEIFTLCKKVGLKCIDRSLYQSVKTQYALAISWRWLINDLPANRLIILHDSLLPRYRGFNPLVSCLINGEPLVGVSALFGAANYDRGDIIAQSSTPIRYPIKIETAIDLVTKNYLTLARHIFSLINQEKAISGTPQDEANASISLWRDDADYHVPWDRSADWIARFVDAVGFPYKGAVTLVNGVRARIIETKPLPDIAIENRTSGKVVWMDGPHPIVVCGQGLLKVLTLLDDSNGQSMLPLQQFRTRFT